MATKSDRLVFNESPVVEFASNTFLNVPVILQYDDQPLIEVVKAVEAGYTTQFSIYSKDGVYLAKAKGSELYCTPEGKKANLKIRHLQGVTVCELNKSTLFLIRRTEASWLKTEAELYAPEGTFIKSSDSGFEGQVMGDGTVVAMGDGLKVGNTMMIGSRFSNLSIGVLLKSDGSVSVGVNKALVK